MKYIALALLVAFTLLGMYEISPAVMLGFALSWFATVFCLITEIKDEVEVSVRADRGGHA